MPRPRALSVAGVALLGLVLTGCADTVPTAVANHESKLEYHADTGAEMLEDSLYAGLAGVENFTATGYTHGKSSDGSTLSVQHEATVLGDTYVTKEFTAEPGMTIDEVHMAGTEYTYYLLGSGYGSVVPTPWVRFPLGDLAREADPQQVCDLSAVNVMCNLVEAWQLSKESGGETIPEHLEVSADGSRHFTSAVTFNSIEESGAYRLGESIRSQLSEEELNSLLPLHAWTDENGVVEKIEVNGTLEGESVQLEMQFGFEVTGEPKEEDAPTDPATVAPQYVTAITSQSESEKFWDSIANVRTG